MKNHFFLLLALLALLQSCAPAKMLRTPTSLEPGYTITIRQQTDSETTVTMFDEEQDQSSSNTVVYNYRVTESLPNGNVKWEMIITHYELNRENNGVSTMYNSADPERDTASLEVRILDKMVGSKMHMTTNASGQILAFSGADALFDDMLSDFKDMPEIKGMTTSLKSSFGDNAMIESVQNMWGISMDKPVRVGEKWKVKNPLKTFGGLISEYTYTLKSKDAQQAVIPFKIKSTYDPKNTTPTDLGVVKVIYQLSGTGVGNITLSQPDGMIQKGYSNLTLAGNMKMSGSGLGNMTVPIVIKTSVTTERIK